MHALYFQSHQRTREVIGAAIAVHRALGPGLLESIDQRCLVHELGLRRVVFEEQRALRIQYRGLEFEESLRCDLLADGCLLVEIKAVQEVLPIHKAQVVSYLRLLDAPLGLLINFHECQLSRGVHRLLLPGADTE